MEALAEAKSKAAEKSKLPKAEIPRPKFRRPGKSIAPAFSSGVDLRKWLMAPPPAAAQKEGFPHTTGNIWEDWGKLETLPQFEDEEEE